MTLKDNVNPRLFGQHALARRASGLGLKKRSVDMEYLGIGGTELNVSALCLGAGNFGAGVPESESWRQMDCFFEKGGNFFDTARVYSDWVPGEKGRSERVIGDYLADRKSRDRWVVSTKGGHPYLSAPEVPRIGREELISDIEESFKALRTDHIDLYYLHRDNAEIGVEEIIGWMNDFVAVGKIRYFGCSNWKVERIREAQQYAQVNGQMGFCANQPLWNVGCYSMKPLDDESMVVMDKKAIGFHRETQLTAIPYSSQAGGFFSKLVSSDETVMQSDYASETNLSLFATIKKLAGKYESEVSHIVLSYLMSQPTAVIPVFSSSSIEQLKDTIRGAEIELSADDVKLLDSLNGSGMG